MAFLVQLLLPRKIRGKEAPFELMQAVRHELTTKFGGVTAYIHNSAEGLWKTQPGVVERDEIVLFEVMTDSRNKRWWRCYRRKLELMFKQTEIVIRAHKILRL